MGKNVWYYLLMINVYTTYDPEILPLAIYPKELCMYAHRHVCVHLSVY